MKLIIARNDCAGVGVGDSYGRLTDGEHLEILFVQRHQDFGVASTRDVEQEAARLHQIARLRVASE